MQQEVCRSPAAFAGVLLPDFAHHKLMQTRDQLLLLSQLAEPRRGDPLDYEFRLQPEALAELFDRMALYLDEALGCAVEPPE